MNLYRLWCCCINAALCDSVGYWACLENIQLVPTVTLSLIHNTLEAIMVSHRTVVGQ